MFLLVTSSVQSKQLLCFVHGEGQKYEHKPTRKEFMGLHNYLHVNQVFTSALKILSFADLDLRYLQILDLFNFCCIRYLTSEDPDKTTKIKAIVFKATNPVESIKI